MRCICGPLTPKMPLTSPTDQRRLYLREYREPPAHRVPPSSAPFRSAGDVHHRPGPADVEFGFVNDNTLRGMVRSRTDHRGTRQDFVYGLSGRLR